MRARSGRRFVTIGGLLLALAGAGLYYFSADPGSFSGRHVVQGAARVIDGDTLDVGGRRVRLHGIDAPEAGQTCRDKDGEPWRCGEAATRRLEAMVQGGHLACRGREEDRYGRLIAVCRTGDLELNRAMVREGLAWSFTRYSRDYEADQAQARAGGRGVFAASNTPPWEHRADQRMR